MLAKKELLKKKKRKKIQASKLRDELKNDFK